MTAVAAPGRAGLRGAVASEWTKLWTVRSTWWCLLVSVLLMEVQAFSMAVSFTNGAVPGYGAVLPVGETARMAIQSALLVLLALPLLAITAEYSTGSMRATLQWVPRRGRVVLAKASVVTAVTFVAGALLAALATAAGALALGEDGLFDTARVAMDLLTIGAYTALLSALTLGVGLAIRSAAGTLIVVFMLVFVLPSVLPALGIDILTRAADYLPGTAGRFLLDGAGSAYGPSVALLVLGGWAVAALLLGHQLLRRRAT